MEVGAEAPSFLLAVLFWLIRVMSFWLRAVMSRRKWVHVRTCTTTRLARGAVCTVMSLVALVMTDVLLGLVNLAAVLALVGFLDNVRMSAFVNVLWSFVRSPVTFMRRFDLATLLVLCTRVLVMYTMLNVTVVMSFVTLHGSLLRSCSIGLSHKDP
jgi:hypothetical protein